MWSQYANSISDDLVIVVADKGMNDEKRSKWATARLQRARTKAPDRIA
jgi:hypothetical protein